MDKLREGNRYVTCGVGGPGLAVLTIPPRASPAMGKGMHSILIVSDIRLYREGLSAILRSDPECKRVMAAGGGQEALAIVRRSKPAVVLIDIVMRDSLRTVRAIAAVPGINVVILSVGTDEEVIACAEAGVSGFVTRAASLDDLRQTLRSAARGELRCSAHVAHALFKRVAKLAAAVPVRGTRPALTRRELEIARLVEKGLSNKEIAEKACIEVATVKNHIHNILDKLHVRRRGEAAARLRPFLTDDALSVHSD